MNSEAGDLCQILFLAFFWCIFWCWNLQHMHSIGDHWWELTAGKIWGRFKASEDKGCGERYVNKHTPPYFLFRTVCPIVHVSIQRWPSIQFCSEVFLTIRLKLFLATLSLTSKTGTWLLSSNSSLILYENWNTCPIPTWGRLAGLVQDKIFWSERVALHRGDYPFRDFGRVKKSFRLVTEIWSPVVSRIWIYSLIPTQWQPLRRDPNSIGWELHVKLRGICL